MISVRRGLAWMSMSQGGLFVIQFGTSLVLARLLSPYEMGVFAVALSIVGLLSMIRSVGLSGYLVRATEPTPAVFASVFTINAALAILLSAMVVGIGALGGAMLGEPGVRRLLLAMAVLPLLSIFEFLPATALERRGDFRAIACVSLLRTLISNAVVLWLAFEGFSYMSLAFGQVAAGIVGVLGFNFIGWKHASFRLGLSRWRDIMRFGLQMLAISGVNGASSRLSELFMARLLGLGALGLFSRASSLNSLLWDNIHVVLTRVIFVEFAEQKRRGTSLRDSYLRIVQMMTALLWPAFAGLAVIAGPLVLTLYGPPWAGAAVPLSLLSVAAIVLVSITMTWEVFVVCGETGRQARFEFIRAGVGLVLFTGGCLISLVGAAAARILDAAFATMLYRPHLERMTNTDLRDFVPIYMCSLTLTVVAVAPSTLVMSLYGWSPDAPWRVVMPSVLLGVLGWVLGLRTLQHPLFDEGRLVLSRLRPSR